MKIYLSIIAALLLLLSAKQIAGVNRTSGHSNIVPIVAQKQTINIDTFFALRTIFQEKSKIIAKDTIVLIMHEIVKPKKKERYYFEHIPYNPFDTTIPKKAKPDTIVWISKPYRP
jgi:hypothetical protein